MATTRTRQRKDGSLAYLSEVRIKRDGETIHRESRTFEKCQIAKARSRSRRPTAGELKALTEFFERRDKQRDNRASIQ